MAQQTAERVARSTGSAVEKLREELDPLEVTKLTAKHVAKSTSEVVKRLRLKDEDDDDYDLEHAGQAVFINGDNEKLSGLDPFQSNSYTSADFLSPKQQPAESAHQGTRLRGLNGTHHLLHFAPMDPTPPDDDDGRILLPSPPSDAQEPVDSNMRTLPTPPTKTRMLHSLPTMLQPRNNTSMTLPNMLQPPPPPKSIDDYTVLSPPGDARMLPALLPHLVQQPGSISENRRTLPSVQPGKKQTFRVPGVSLTNGYQHSPVLPKHDFKQGAYDGSWTRSADSDSEYSTTESIEQTSQFILLTPAELAEKQVKNGDADLKTNPMKRMSHTAEMVAESTGKAVHKLTSTLSSSSQ